MIQQTTIRIRAATAADVPELHRIRLAVRENRLADPGAVQPTDYVRKLTETGAGWVAELDERIVGFAIADLELRNVWALFVEPAYDGRGAGRMLHDAMMNWFAEQGVAEVWLRTEPGTRAERFYKVAGWQRLGMEGGEVCFRTGLAEWRDRAGARV